jgi:hypothetical protein
MPCDVMQYDVTHTQRGSATQMPWSRSATWCWSGVKRKLLQEVEALNASKWWPQIHLDASRWLAQASTRWWALGSTAWMQAGGGRWEALDASRWRAQGSTGCKQVAGAGKHGMRAGGGRRQALDAHNVDAHECRQQPGSY